MRRREFITLLSGAAIAGPQAAFAQPSSKVYRLGTLSPGAPFDDKSPNGAILVRVLAERGYTLGQNLTFDARGAVGQIGKLCRRSGCHRPGRLARPGGNITDISDVATTLSTKRLSLLQQLNPKLRRVAMLWNKDDLGMSLRYEASAKVAQSIGITVQPLGVRVGEA